MIGCRPLTDAEIQQVLLYLKTTRDKALFTLGCRTGFRISELLSIRLKDVMEYGRISNRITVYRRNMKGKTSSRSVPLHPEAKLALETYLAETKLNPDDLLFPFVRQHAWRLITKAVRRAKLSGKIGTHGMRKTFADRVFTALDENIFKTQQALGHADPASTVKYLSFRQEEIEDAILGIK